MAQRFEFEAIGTSWTIDIEPANAATSEIIDSVKKRINEFDRNYSRFRSDSLITQMSQQAGSYTLPPDAQTMFDLYRDLYEISMGAVTPLIGQALVDAGYDANYSLAPKNLRPVPKWGEAISYSIPQLTIKQPVVIDLGALGKGHLVDIVSNLLRSHHFSSFTINAGGDIAHRSSSNQPLRVALEHPTNPSQAVGVATIANQSLCGSAINRRSWADFNHLIDPQTLKSPTNILAIWATADSTILADAITTGLFFMPAAVLRRHFDFEYALIYNDLSLEHSTNFPAEFFKAAEQ